MIPVGEKEQPLTMLIFYFILFLGVLGLNSDP
jgi:hypothetical protein